MDLTEKELKKYLEELKSILIEEEKQIPETLEFINSKSFYDYYKCKKVNNYTIDEIMSLIEDCIPLALQADSLKKFLETCSESENSYKLKSFLDSCKVEFLHLINYSKNDSSKWFEVLVMCESLRKQAIISNLIISSEIEN